MKNISYRPNHVEEEELWDDASCDGTGFAQCGQPSPRPLLPPRRQTRQSKEY